MTEALPNADLPEEARSVLRFWFVDLMPENWFSTSEPIDETIAQRFADLHGRAASGDLDDWTGTPRGTLALIIVLDQFSRNIHRTSGKAFACDEKAQSLAVSAIRKEFDERLGLDERQFLYMPLMHAEDRDLQALALEKYEALARSAQEIVGFARMHHSIIERFGRFPYRNPLLGRESSDGERAFIEKDGNPFS
ncbi:MAG: DUF924 family protein [Erythrobacter sp.]|nr:DUF924 family protein [Erythrobacter sp.]